MAFPRIFQRLFANSGAGPKLRHDIIPWDEESRITSLEAWRQAMIGTPMPMASTTLPPGFMWADGSFASFATYPELKAKYDAGGFAGMLLPYTAQEGDISAHPGKFKPDAANPTGLFLPRLTGCLPGTARARDAESTTRRARLIFLERVVSVLQTGNRALFTILGQSPPQATLSACLAAAQYMIRRRGIRGE